MSASVLPAHVRRTRQTGFAAWAALALLQVVWHAGWHPPVQGSAALAATVATLPLLLPLLAMRRPSRALLWAGIIALFYFAHGISTAWSLPAARLPALLESFFSVVLIGALGVGAKKREMSEEK